MAAVAAEPVLKRCSKCKEYKDRENDFSESKVKRGNRIYVYPYSLCKKCCAKRSAKYREHLKATGEFQSAQRRWESKRDKHATLRRQREWYRMTRGERLSHVWKKYEHELALGNSPRTLNSLLIYEYLDRFLIIDDEDGSYKLNGVKMTQNDTHRLKRWRKGNPKRITERQVDEICVAYDLPPWEAIEAGKMTV